MPGARRDVLRCSLWAVVLTCAASLGSHGQSNVQSSQTLQPQPKQDTINPTANRSPNANDIQAMRDKQAVKQKFEAANIERKRQLASDSGLLLKLAKELKSEIEANPKEALSDGMMKKAEEIERLARNVQVKMKLTVGSS